MATYFFETITAARALCFAAKEGDPGTGGGGGGKKPDDTRADEKPKEVAATEADKTPGGGLLDPATVSGGGDPAADLVTANAEIDRLRAALESATAAHEDEVASLRASLQASDQRHEDLKALMVGGASGNDIAEAVAARPEAEADGLVDVRVRSPMLVQPVVPPDYDPHYDGPIPAPFSLVAGLNRVPPHIADHWLVKGNLAAEA